MKYTDTVIIGGGQAGLAMSRCLWECGVKHVVHGAGLPRPGLLTHSGFGIVRRAAETPFNLILEALP